MPSSTTELMRCWNRTGQRNNKHRHWIKGPASFGGLFGQRNSGCFNDSADSIVNMKFKGIFFIYFAHGVDWNI